MNILVTGGAGFIGSHLIDRLIELKHFVICYDNFDPFYDRNIKVSNLKQAINSTNFKLVEADINDKASLTKCFNDYKIDLVFHLAAKAGVRPSIIDPLSYYMVNVIGTVNLLEVMKMNGLRNLIFASSSSVYGNSSKVPFNERCSVDEPISPYASTKKAGELICYTYHHLYSFNIFCFRFFTVYGPRQRPDLAIHKFSDLILNNESVPMFGHGKSSRDYTYIDDIIDGLIKSVNVLKGYRIINLGGSKPVTLDEMVIAIENYLGIKAKKSQYPAQPGDVNVTCADISYANEILGYDPKQLFSDGIAQFLNWKLSENI